MAMVNNPQINLGDKYQNNKPRVNLSLQLRSGQALSKVEGTRG